MLRAARNIAIVLGLAAAVEFVPGGGAGAAAVNATFSVFFVAIAIWMALRIYSDTELTRLSVGDRERATLYGAIAVLVVLVAGIDEMFGSALGRVSFVALAAGSIFAILDTLRQARAY